MTFNSLSYFLFLPLVYLFFRCANDRYRWLVLLVASYSFYACFKAPLLLLVLALVTAISFVCGLRLARTTKETRRKLIFWLGMGSFILTLAGMKYLPHLWIAYRAIEPLTSLPVSIGVSYFTFQAMSYLIDVHLGIQEPEQHIGYHALYLAFFPKLLQGPIERAGSLLPQLKKPFQFDYLTIRSAVLLFAWGAFKKIVLADRLAIYVDAVYNNAHDYTGLPLTVATYAFALQIYFDFAGYTDMARGTAKLFGINLTENFNNPYLASSVADFWRRWHISFSRWILDYIFKPLQIAWRDWNRLGTALALIITFLICGIWHGSTWGFVIWGLMHGMYMAASIYYQPLQRRVQAWLGIDKSKWLRPLKVFLTFNLVSAAWIFFRANTLSDGIFVLREIFSDFRLRMGDLYDVVLPFTHDNTSISHFVVMIALLLTYVIVRRSPRFALSNSFFVMIVVLILFLGKFSGNSFIYLNF